jgi:hemerythrin-like domain-containing protein
MDAFEVMMEEHGIILMAIDILKQSAIKEMSTDFCIKLLDIIRDFADRCHHGKEEIALFPLVKQKDMSQSENISILLGEHEKARSLIAAIRQAIDKNDSQGKLRNINDYFQLLTQHISKENELFVSWFKLLNSYDKDLLFKEFEKIEEKVIGIGKHEEYLINLKNMKSQIKQSE